MANAMTLMQLFSVKADSERRENRYDFFTSDVFRLRPVIGHPIRFRKIVPPIKHDIDQISINF